MSAFFFLFPLLSILSQEGGDDQVGIIVALFQACCSVIFAIIMIIGMWKVFTKAGQPGWASIIPIYNLYIWLKIIGREWWWLLLMLIPFVNLVIFIIINLDLAKSFGKSAWFGVGLILLPFIFLLILAFGDAKYQGPLHI